MPLRPGISDETLTRLGIRRVKSSEAKMLTGVDRSGIYIPFGINCVGGPYGRLRLDVPIGDMKYHQRKGSKVHNYIQPDIALKDGTLILIEGEFKAISLTEAGFPAVGTSGFYSWGEKQDSGKPGTKPKTVLQSEIAGLIDRLKPDRLVFVGDPDTALNLSFGDAMSKLAEACPVPVAIVRIPYDAPHGKGVDDIREKMGNDAFCAWFADALKTATPLTKGITQEEIIGYLIERERDTFPTLTDEKREKAIDQLSKLYASIYKKKLKSAKALTTTVTELATGVFKLTTEKFSELVDEVEKKRLAKWHEETDRKLKKSIAEQKRGAASATVAAPAIASSERITLAAGQPGPADASPDDPAEGDSGVDESSLPALPFPSELFDYEEALKSFVMVGDEFYTYSYARRKDGTYERSQVMSVCSRTFVFQVLRAAGFDAKKPSTPGLPIVGYIPNLSQLDAALFYLSATRCVGFTNLLFRPYGPLTQPNGTRLFNKSLVRPMEPIRGEPPVTDLDDPRIASLKLWLTFFFGAGDGLPHFLSLLSYVYKAARNGTPKKTRAVFLLGTPNSGKSLLIDKVVPMIFGQTSASDADRLIRGEMGTASILDSYVCKLSDKNLGGKYEIRRYQQGMLALLADHTTGGRALYQDVQTMEVTNLFMLSSNPDGSVVKILDNMPPSILEKFAIYENEFNLDQMTAMQDALFDKGQKPKELIAEIIESLPYLCSLLENWKCPAEFQEDRFGVCSFIPERFKNPSRLSPVEELVRDALIEHSKDITSEKTAKVIYETIIAPDENLKSEVKASQMVEILTRLSSIEPDLVETVRGGKQGRRFKITPSKYKAMMAEAEAASAVA